jgi:hypothetical protein
MTMVVLFWALAILCCGYGAYFGGRDGRLVAALYMGGVLLSIPAYFLQQSWGGAIWPVIVIDLLFLVGIYWISMRTNRFWPLWVTGFHMITMTAHLAALLAPSFPARIYFGLTTIWTIPLLLVILVGVTLDRQAGLTDHDTA